MKLKYKILTGLISSLLLITLTLALSADSIVKSLILKYGPQYTGRKIELQEAKVNIFKFKGQLVGFKIYEKNEKDLFFSIDKFDLDLHFPYLLRKKIKIEGIGLENPKINIKKEGDKYNFVDIIENIKKQGKAKTEEKTKKDNTISVMALELKNLYFEYKDEKMENKFKIQIDSFSMPLMTIGKDIDFSFNLISRNNIELASKIKISEKEINIENEKLFLNFDTIYPFIKTQLNVSKLSGILTSKNKININLDKNDFNFTGKNQVKNIELITSDNEKLFTLENLVLDIENLSTLKEELFIKELSLTKPFINYDMYAKGSNFDKIFYGPSENAISFKNYKINNLELKEGSFNFTDSKKNEKFNAKLLNVNLKTKDIFYNKEGFILDLGFNLNNPETRIDAKIDTKDNKFKNYLIDLDVNNLKLSDFTHYIKDSINISSLKGNLFGKLLIENTHKNDKNHLKIKGTSEISKLSLIDKRKSAEILNMESVKLDIEEISLPDNRIIINDINMNSLKLYAYIAKDGNTMALLFPPPKNKETKKQEKPMYLLLKNINFKKGSLKFSDDTFPKPFTYILDIPSATGKNISSKKEERNSMYKVDVITNRTGRFTATGNVVLGKNFETNSNFVLSNFNFADFKQFSEKYSNFSTNKGILNYQGSFVLKNNKINSQNNAKIQDADLGEKEKILPLGISINFVLGLIANDDNEVTIILPVEGDLTNPKFSYKKTLFIALKNMFVNIATAPFQFMKNDDGEDGRELQNLEVEMLKSDLPSVSIKKLEKIAGLLKKKPMLKFEFLQVVDKEIEYEKLIMARIKRNYYISKNLVESTEALKDEDYKNIEALSDLDEGLVSYINQKSLVFENSQEMDLGRKAELILGKEKTNNEFEKLILARNKFIEEKISAMGIAPERITVRFATKEEEGEHINARYVVKLSSM